MSNPDEVFRFIINCILHIVILFTILGTFFIYYISHVEERAFQKEINNLVDNELKPSLDQLSPDNKLRLQQILQQLPLKTLELPYQKSSKYVQINNEWLRSRIWLVVGFGFTILGALLLMYYIRCRGKLDFVGVLVENIIIFIIVGAIEITFFLNIATKYVPVQPSLMTNVFVSHVKDKISP